MREKICGVYVIQSTDGRVYVGSSVDVAKRWSEHKSRLRHGKHNNPILSAVIADSGVESLRHRLLLSCSPDNLRMYEQIAIEDMKPALNVLPTAEKILTEQWKRPDFRARNSERASRQNSERWSNPEFLAKARERAAAMNTKESKAKALDRRNQAMMARGQAYQNVSAAASANFKRMHADPEFAKAHAERMRQGMLERCKDPEFCRKRNEAVSRMMKKPIRCLTTGEIFPSKKEAAQSLGISVSLITKQLNGLPTRTKLQWEFIND